MEWTHYNTENINSRYLFKFLSEKNLMKFLDDGNLWFARSDMFGDKMECVMIKDLQNPIPDFKKIESRKRKHLISCFHEGNKETLAFWDTYAKTDEDRRKFAIRFNREDLVNLVESNSLEDISISNISNLIHGKVRYKNLIGASNAKLESKKVRYPAFRKEYVFAYEKEYRFDILLQHESELIGHNLKIGEPIDIDFSIFVNPLLESQDYISCLKRIKESKFKNKLKLSTLTKWLRPELWK